MPEPQINYVKALYQSIPNLFFIGVMIFLSLAINPALLFLLLAGELGALLLAQTRPVRSFLRAQAERERQREQEKIEAQILEELPQGYKTDFQALKQLCREIERRAGEVEKDSAAIVMVRGAIEKLSSFRFEYLRMLRAHFLLANRNYKEMQRRLEEESRRIEQTRNAEQSEQIRAALEQNLQILRQRASKLRQLDELVRLIEARLQVVRNSMQLIQDEVDSMTDVRGISHVVDELLVNLEMNDEYRSFYDDMLSDQGSTLAGLDSVEQAGAGPEAQPKPRSGQLDRIQRK